MPTPATMNASASRASESSKSAPIAAVPFIRASAEHREPCGIDVSKQITASDQELGVFDIPAYGYVRSIVLLVTASGGAGASVTAKSDAPFTALKNIAFTEPNGATLHQFNTGHDLYLANKYGGYRNVGDAKIGPVYQGVSGTGGNFQFMLRIPIEINPRDGLGSLPNQNAAATFKLRLTLGKIADIYGTAPTTAPTVRVQAFLEAWDQPESQSQGRVNQITPPAVNTTQYWSSQSYNVNAGQQTIRLTRVGNYIRNMIFVWRDASGNRNQTTQANFPTQSTLYLDTRPLDIVAKELWLAQMVDRSGYIAANEAANGLDDSVFLVDYTHEFTGQLGYENRDLWLPTLGSTRLELQGVFGSAGTLTVLTNDVSVAGEAFL